MTQPSDNDYLLGSTEAEAQRLQEQARRMETETRAVLARLVLPPGSHCLDVGCGAGDAMKLMAELVGPGGSVTGLDRNVTIEGARLEALRAASPAQIDFIQDDVLTTTALVDNTFDLTFARLVLLHMSDPRTVISRMWRWTKPGGYLLLMDYDFVTQGAYPPVMAINEYNRLIFDLFPATGRDVSIGRKLPTYIAEVCSGEPVQTNVDTIFLPLREIVGMLAAGYRSLLPTALQLGITTEAQAEQFFTDMKAAQMSSAYFFSPLLVVFSQNGRWYT